MKKYRISLISLFAALFVALLALAFALNFTAPAYAADRYVKVDGYNVFYTTIRGADVTDCTEGEGEATKHYTLFKIGDGETVTYRQNLAYFWYTGIDDEDGTPYAKTTERFSMSIGFGELNFDRYIIKFQSQQYLSNEDKITENFLIFTPSADKTKVNLYVSQTDDKEKMSEAKLAGEYAVADGAKIEIAFSAFVAGNYSISVNGTDTGAIFKNVYETYAKYVSSGDNAVTPLTFTAEFAEGATGKAEMKLYELNGQSFELFDNDGDGVYSQVKDNQPPVMCFNSTPSYVEYGSKLNLDFTLIDVLTTSPRYTANYYILSGTQYGTEGYDFDKLVYETSSSSGTEGGAEETKQENPFISASSSSSIRLNTDSDTFIPSDMFTEDNRRVHGLVKLYYEVSDVAGSSAQKDIVFASWYAKESALVDIYAPQYLNDNSKQSYFLKLVSGKDGATYAHESDTDIDAYKASVQAFEEEYQTKIDDAIKAIKDEDGNVVGELFAGSSNKFYLPEFGSFEDEYCNVQDYKYSVYYKAKTSGSNTSLAYNNLYIDLKEADVTYVFTVFITDKFDNPMRYPVSTENGETVWEEITKDDVWDEDFVELLPYFEFKVSYKEVTAKDPTKVSLAYVGSTYNGVTFDINGVSGTYETKYTLYVFDRNAAHNDLGLDLTYDEYVTNYEKLFDNTYMEGKNTRAYFTTVKPSSQLVAADSNYDELKDLAWNETSVSFVPQSAEDYYTVELELKDNRSGVKSYNYATVVASVQANSLKGESDWLENNTVSIVLLSVAGVCLIALVVLLIVKPKDKGDIDAVYAEETEKKGKKKKNNKS